MSAAALVSPPTSNGRVETVSRATQTAPPPSAGEGSSSMVDTEEMVPWRKKALSIEIAFWKMIENQNKAIDEHNEHYKTIIVEKNPYLQPSELAIDSREEEATPPRLSPQFDSDIGKTRERNEDAHFYQEGEEGALAGVFDGHLGKEVSNFANNKFQELFPTALEQAEGNVHTAFEMVIHQIHQEVTTHSEWDGIGSVAVICYIDKKTHWVYTATLSDCEANIYRKVGKELKSIPLSPVRDWLSKRDRARLQAYHRYRMVDSYIAAWNNDPKRIYSHLFEGVNTPRAIGDKKEIGTRKYPLVSHKPKITTFKLYAGDILILACDGLKDFLSEEEIVQIIQNTKENLSPTLVKAAVAKMNKEEGGDNVTVGAIHVS